MSEVLMKSVEQLTVAEISDLVGGNIVRGGDLVISGINDVETAGEGDLAFVMHDERRFESAEKCKASCLIIPRKIDLSARFPAKALIEVDNPRLAVAIISEVLYPPIRREPSIHSTAVIAPTAEVDISVFVGPHSCIGERSTIGPGSRIEANVVIGDGVTVGRECVLHPGVVLYNDICLGDRVILHAGVCIGADGFGWEPSHTGYHKLPQIGSVNIEDDVELGSYTCVDRAPFGNTRIGKGTKLDNMVHVGHGSNIGERVVIAAQTGISGSVIIEDEAMIGGQVGFGDRAHIEKGTVIGSKAGILPKRYVKSLSPHDKYWGIPIRPFSEYGRLNGLFSRLPDLFRGLKRLQSRVEQLEEKLSSTEFPE